MGLDTLVDHIDGQVIDADDINIIHRALENDFVGRDASGAVAAGKRLGTPALPWGTVFTDNLILNGLPIAPALVTAQPNRVISGAIRSTSDFPDYLRAAGSSASFTVLGATTPLEIDVNATIAQITTDIIKSGLTTASGHGTTDICRIADVSLSGQDNTRFLGENRTSIPVDLMGSELTAKIGEFVALLNQTTNEIMYCRVASATKLDYARRGFWFNSSGNPIEAAPLTNSQLFQLLSLAFIFAEDDGGTIDVTYNNPKIGGSEPASPSTGDYWYDLTLKVWKRYSGSSFDQIDRTFIGTAVIDPTNCIATRPEYFSKRYQDTNTLTTRRRTDDIIESSTPNFAVSVDGSDKRFDFGFFTWDASTDFESGVTRTASRDYWLYLTEDGTAKISNKKPYETLGFLRGWYHPYNSWRAVAHIFNNASNDFREVISPSDENLISLDGVDISLLDRIILSNNSIDSDHDIDSTAGKFTTDDDKNQFSAPAFTKRLDANWTAGSGNGGSPGITLAANTTYHYFALTNGDGSQKDFGMDTALTASNLLAYAAVVTAGLTKASYQGSLLTDASSNIRGFHQIGKYFWLNIRAEADISGVTAAGTSVTLDTPVNIETVSIVRIWAQPNVGATTEIYILFNALDENNVAPTQVNSDIVLGNMSGVNALNYFSIEKLIKTNASSQIRGRVNSTNFTASSLITLGWIDEYLKA
jgi:hypothetical protein